MKPRSLLVALSAAALVLGAVPAGSAAEPLAYELWAYRALGDGASVWAEELATGDTVAQPFTASASGTVGEVVEQALSGSEETQLVAAITDDANWPDPGVVLGSAVMTHEYPHLDEEGAADFTSENVALVKGERYVLTWTVTAGSPQLRVVADLENALDDRRLKKDGEAQWTSVPDSVLWGVARVSGVDGDDPALEVSIDPAQPDGRNGWYVTAPTVSFTCREATTWLLDGYCPEPWTPPSDGSGTSSWMIHDYVGHQADVDVTINLDRAAPAIRWSSSRPPNRRGWYREPVRVVAHCGPSVSDVVRCSGTGVYRRTTRVTSVSRDLAGNASSSRLLVRVDTRAPIVTIPGLAPRQVLSVVPDLRCQATDGLGRSASGVRSCETRVEKIARGKYKSIAVAKDDAGNRSRLRLVFFLR